MSKFCDWYNKNSKWLGIAMTILMIGYLCLPIQSPLSSALEDPYYDPLLGFEQLVLYTIKWHYVMPNRLDSWFYLFATICLLASLPLHIILPFTKKRIALILLNAISLLLWGWLLTHFANECIYFAASYTSTPSLIFIAYFVLNICFLKSNETSVPNTIQSIDPQ